MTFLENLDASNEPLIYINFKKQTPYFIGDNTYIESLDSENVNLVEGDNLNALWRKLNILARQLAKRLDVEKGVFAYNPAQKATNGYKPFTLFLADGQVITAEVKNKNKKRWDKNAPMQIDYWLLNRQDITPHIKNLKNPIPDIVKIVKGMKYEPKLSQRVKKLIAEKEKLELELKNIFSIDYPAKVNKLLEIIKEPTLKTLEESEPLAKEIDEKQNLISKKRLEELEGEYNRSIEGARV